MLSRNLKLTASTLAVAVAGALYACHSDDVVPPLTGPTMSRDAPSRPPSSFVGTVPVTPIDDIPITPTETVAAAPN